MQQNEFQQLLWFTAEDPIENKNGRISASQRMRHLFRIGARFLILCLTLGTIFIGSVLVILGYDIAGGRSALICILPIGALLGILGLVYSVGLLRALIDILNKRVEHVYGPFSISRYDQRQGLVVDGVCFWLWWFQARRLRPHIGQWITVYYLRSSKRILSVQVTHK